MDVFGRFNIAANFEVPGTTKAFLTSVERVVAHAVHGFVTSQENSAKKFRQHLCTFGAEGVRARALWRLAQRNLIFCM